MAYIYITTEDGFTLITEDTVRLITEDSTDPAPPMVPATIRISIPIRMG